MPSPEFDAHQFNLLERFIDAKIAEAMAAHGNSGRARAGDRLAVKQARRRLIQAVVPSLFERNTLGED